jgi:hypothetical protein
MYDHFPRHLSLNRLVTSARRRSRKRDALPRIERMEPRQLLSTFYVTNNGDSGTGSLRAEIDLVNSDPLSNGEDIIEPNSSIGTIDLLSALPDLTRNDVTIQDLVIDGSGAGSTSDGLDIQGSGVAVVGMGVSNFGGVGIYVATSSVQIEQSQITDNGGAGIEIDGGGGNTIGGTAADDGNLISGNGGAGIFISAAGTAGNLVVGNLIGTDATGSQADGNDGGGVYLSGSNNTIGGVTPAARNIIAASGSGGFSGININGSDGDLVEGNYIGTDEAGTAALGNVQNGISIFGGGASNTIGGTAVGAGNLISGNGWDGVAIVGAGTTGNLVQGNLIGTDVTGTKSLGNVLPGVIVFDGATANTIGGDAAGDGNVISGNQNDGVVISGQGTDQNVVAGNFIGTDASGTAPLGNAYQGLDIDSGASDNTIGGQVGAGGNVISGNDNCGIYVVDSGTSGNLITGNLVGTDVTGTQPLGNAYQGMYFGSGTSDNTIGGVTAGLGNVISANDNGGIWLDGSSDDLVEGNMIGTDITGTVALGNTYSGIYMSGASGNTIGGEVPGAANVLSGNGNYGVGDTGTGSRPNVLVGDKIGINVDGTVLDNAYAGIFVSDGGVLTLESGLVVAGGMSLTAGGEVNVSGSSNRFSGKVDMTSKAALNVFGANNAFSGGVTASKSALISVFNSGNTISGSLYLSSSTLTIFGTDDTLSVDGTVDGGLLKISGSNNAVGGNVSVTNFGLMQLYGNKLTLSGSVSLSDYGTLQLNGNDNVVSASIDIESAGGLDITGASNRMSGSVTFDGDSFDVTGASNTITGAFYMSSGALTVSGPDASLDVTGPVSLTGGSVSANSGGTLRLPLLTSISSYYGVHITATGADSVVDISALESWSMFTYSGYESSLTVTDGGTVEDGSLTTLGGVDVTLDGTGDLTVDQWASLTDGALRIQGGDYTPASSNPFSDLDNINGSGLYVSGGGALTLTGVVTYDLQGSNVDFSASGSGAVLSLPNLTSISAGGGPIIGAAVGATGGSLNFVASGGGQVLAPVLLSITDTNTASFGAQVSGDGSLIDLPELSTFQTNYGTLSANGGGTLDMPSLTTITSDYGVTIQAAGSQSSIDLADLQDWTTNYGDYGYGSTLSVTQGATVDDGDLTSLSDVDVTLDGTGILEVSQWTSLTGGSLKILSGNYAPTAHAATSDNSFANLSNINGSGLYVSGGGALTLPAVVTYDPEGRDIGFSAAGSGAVLNLPGLTSVSASGSSYYYSGRQLNFRASSGGQVRATALTSITDNSYTSIGAQAIGADSLVDLSAVTAFGTYNGTIEALQGGTVDLGSLTILESVNITVDGTSTLSIGQLASLNYSNLSITGGTFDDATLTDIDNTSLYVSGGATLILSGIDTYANNEYSYGTTFGATDTTYGGTIELTNLNKISGDYGVNIDASGTGSAIDLPLLATWTIVYDEDYGDDYASTLSVTNGAQVEDGDLINPFGVDVTLDGTGTLAVEQWQSLIKGGIDITGGDYAPTAGAGTSSNSFVNLSDIDGSALLVSGGGSLSLPDVTTYQALDDPYVFSEYGNVFEATGTNSTLSLPNLGSITASSTYYYYYAPLTIEAQDGGQVLLTALTSINTSNYDAPVSVESDGTDSLINLSLLTTYDVTDYGYDGAILSATNDGTIELNSQLTNLDGVKLELDGTGVIPISQFTSINDGGIHILGGNYGPTSQGATAKHSFTGLDNINGSGLYVSGGGSLDLTGIDSYLTDGQDVSFSASGTHSGLASKLTLPDLAGINPTAYDGGALTIEANAGGQVQLTTLTSIDTAGDDLTVSVTANGTGSTVDLSALTTYDVGSGGRLSATNYGTVDLNQNLTSLIGVTIVVDGTGTLPTGQFTSVTDGGITVEEGDYTSAFQALDDIDDSSLLVYGGGSLELLGITTYTSDYNSFQAYEYDSAGTIDLPNLGTIGGYEFSMYAEGTGSVIDLPVLTSITLTGYGYLYVIDHGTVDDPDLTTLTGVDVELDGTGTMAVAQWTSLTHGELDIDGGDYSPTSSSPSSSFAFTNLSDIDDSSLYVYGGGSLTLPAVTSYTGDGNTLEAYTYYSAEAAATLSLPQLGTIGGYDVDVYAYGPVSEIDLSSLTSFSVSYGSLYVLDQATVLDGDLTTLNGVDVYLNGTGTIATSQWTSLTDGILTIEGGNYSSTTSPPFAGLSDIDGSSVYVYGGGSLTLPAVTSYANDTGDWVYLDAYQPYGSTVGVLSLPALTTITGSYIEVQAYGSGSAIDLASLSTVDFSYDGYLSFTNQGTFDAPDLGTLTNVTLTTDTTVTLTVASGQTYSFPAGTSTITTGTLDDQGSVQVGGGQSFTLSDYPGGGDGIIQTQTASQSSPSSFDIAVNIADPTVVYALINSIYGEYGDTVGAVEFEATGGLVYTVDLVEGQNIRDFNNDGYNDLIGEGALGGTYLGSVSYGGGQVRLDELGFDLPAAFQSATLTDIILLGYGNVPDGEPFLAGATVATSNGPVPVDISSLVNSNLQTYSNGGYFPPGGTTVQPNATVAISGNLTIDGQGALTIGPGSTLEITGNLTGNTTNAAGFNVLGSVVFDGDGTSTSPQYLQVLSQDLGDTTAGFTQNFVYNTLELTNDTYVELMAGAGGSPEALYVNDLIVPAGTTLNLNGLNLYIHTEQISGTIIGGGAIITGEVYDDVSGSGSLASGDPGLSGWTVTLTDTATSATYTTATDANGDYAFTGIAPGSYTLSETVQAGFAQTDPASPGTYSLTVAPGQVISGEDFGDHPTASISGVVFDDLDGSGTLGGSDSGLSGWTVNLLNSANAIIGTFTTSTGGAYSFASLLPGSYTVQVVSQSDYVATSSTSVGITDDNGQADTVNFGEFETVTIGGKLTSDTNGSGLSGWTVDLIIGGQTQQETTLSDGSFSFAGVGPGSYTVEAVQQSGYVASPGPLTGSTTSGANISGLALGEFQTVTISGEVYDDLDDSGTFSASDPGLAGWTVELSNGSQTTTNDSGDYSFTGIGPGTYTITDVVQTGFVQTAPASGSFSVTTASGTNISGEDFGAIAAARLEVTGLAVTPSSLQSGTSLVVSWDDTNGSTTPITASFTDHIVITNTTTGQVLGVADVPYDVATRGGIAAGASAAQQYAFTLPNGDPGVGDIEFTVTADAYDAVSGGLSASGRTTSITSTSTLAPYADLVPGNITAPATAAPGQTVTVTWTDTNNGDAATPSGWVDEILLSYDGTIVNAVPVGTLAVSGPIAAGSSANEQAQVTIPVTGAASSGSLQFVIVTNADSSFFELDTANGAAIDSSPIDVPATLTLVSTVSSIDEDAANPQILGTILRSGPTTNPLTVTLTSSDTAQFTVPATVTIPAGQSSAPVTFTVLDDGIVDPNQTDTITAAAAGFVNGTVGITDINTDTYDLSVSFATSPATVDKGSFITATVTRTGSDASAMTVTLGTNTPNKIYLPGTVTIPAGSTSTTFNVQAINDDEIEGTQTYGFTASAIGFTSAVGDVTVIDTDVPTLGLSLTETTENESAGPMATTATLTASFASDQAVVVDLSAPAGSPVTLPTSVTIPANQTSVTFPVGTFDNGSTLGIQAVSILAEVTTDTDGAALTQGSASATLDVVNANAPTLSVTFASPAVLQDEAAATTGTVTIENASAPTSPVTVTLSSSNTSSATVPTTVVIPAGQTSVTFTIATPADTHDLGTVEPLITASASGYATTQSPLIVTDTPEPNDVVSSITAPDPGNGQTFTISYTVTNQGTATAVGPWQDAVWITDQPTGGTLTPLIVDQPGTPTNTIDYNGDLPVGDSYSRTLTVFAPEQTGNYWVLVQTDSDLQLTQATTSDTSTVTAAPVPVVASYTATVQANLPLIDGVKVGQANTPISLSGTATLAGGGPAQDQIIDIYIDTAGTQRAISAITDAEGLFSAEFDPLPGEAGTYQILAANPGVDPADVPVQDNFDILGMSAQPPSASLSTIVDAAAASGQVTLTNLASNLPLSDLQASVVGAPSNLVITTTLGDGSPDQGLAGGGTLTLTYDVSSTSTSTPSGSFTIEVTSTEGATVDIPITFNVIPDQPIIVASPTSLQAGMIIGDQTIIELTLDNQGGAASGPLQIMLPTQQAGADFLSLASSATVDSIPVGGSTQITLLLTPPAGMALGTYTGTIVVQGSSGGTSIPFKFINQSSAVGEIDITTVDEYTYFAQGAPNLAGAAVTATNALTDQVYSGVTNAQGQLDLSNLPVGTYDITATSPGNDPYDGSAVVNAGQVTPVTAFLPLQLVTTTFTVEPTSVQDDIQVQVNTTFEANVPAPVITTSPSYFDASSLTAAGDSEQINLTITNHGLVSAINMQLSVGTDPDYAVTFLISDIGTLPAESSITIPVIITRTSDGTTGPCSLPVTLTWQIPVINTDLNYSAELAIINLQGDCPPGQGGGEGGVFGYTTPIAAGDVIYEPIAVTSYSDCDACETATDAALLQFSQFPDWESAGAGMGASLAGGATDVMADASSFISALVSYLQATPDVGEAVSLIDTALAAVAACESSDTDPTTSVIQAREMLDTFANGFKSLVNETDDIFGSSDWINGFSGPELTTWLTAFAADASGGQAITSGEASSLESMIPPEEVTLTDVQNFIARWNQTITYNAEGIYDSTQVPSGGTANFIPRDVWASDLQATNAAYATVATIGSANFSAAILYEMQQLTTDTTISTPLGGVCTQVTLQLDQSVVVTLNAFNATLSIQNDKTDPVTNIGVTIEVTNAQGDNVTNLFDIESPALTGLTAVDGTGTLAPSATGQAVFTLIPTNAAAPTTSTFYYVSAELTYQVDGMSLAIPFSAQTITVEPSPSLTIRYFEQSAVYGPDAYNPNAPSQPFALGVQVFNTGAGTANDVSIISAQPQILSSLSGLLASFQLLATQVNGQNLTPSLTVDLGSIAPGGLSTALFLMTSSVGGQFVSYSASFEDDSALGTAQPSIVNSLEIYNMIHLASEVGPGASTGDAFLVSDVPGASSLPNAVFLPDGAVQPVTQATDPVVTGTLGNGNLQVTLTDTPTSGWSYLDTPDPGMGDYELVNVTRSDGISLPVNDFWQTDETYVSDGQPPIPQNMLHILDDDSTGSYTLTYVPINQLQPTITSISSVSPDPTTVPVGSLQVTFDEPIAIGTLDANDFSLTLDGGSNLISSSSGVTVSLVSGSTYEISGLAGLDTGNGTYDFTVNAAGVEDEFGNPGVGSASTIWEMAASAPAVSMISGVTAGLRNTAVDSVDVTFTQAIDPSSFGLSALSLTENGGPNLITAGSGVTIAQQGSSDTYVVSGLGSLTTPDGDYVLTVDATQVTSSGVAGIGTGSVAWTMDTVPPTVQSFSTVATPRNTTADDIDVTFSEPINLSTFTDSALSLTLNGGGNLINGSVAIALVSGSTYQISGLSALDAANGTYLLTVDGADISDLAGNVGTNSLSLSWLMETTVPASPTDLAISPNTGVSAGLTDTGVLTLTGTLAATALTVDVFDETTDTDLGPATVNGTTFSMALNLPAGTTELDLTDEDGAGNISAAASYTVFVDETSPMVSSFVPVTPSATNTPVGSVEVTFTEPINLSTFTLGDLSLTDNGGSNLITDAVTIDLVSGSTYAIGGLSGLTTAEGTYVLTVDAAGLQDEAGNAGTGSLSTSWLMDTTPPTSSVGSLPAQTTNTGILVSTSGTDPNGANGSTPSGIAFFTLYVSDDGGPFTPFATVTPTDPSALFTGQPGHTYGFYSIATDNAGNVQPTPTAAQQTVQITSSVSISSIAPVSSPTNKAVSTIDVTFTAPINTASLTSGALTLTDDGGPNLINAGVTLTLVSGDTYAIGGLSGLTAAQGEYMLTVNAADLQDENGIAGTGSLSTSWLMDTTAPSSHVVNALGTSQTSDTFPVTVDFSDPAGPGGAPASGVASVSLYYSVNNGPFKFYQTITLTTPETSGSVTFSFVGQDRNIYAFHSIAEDAAGNTESKNSNAIEASTSVPDLHPPVTQVLSSSAYSNGVFTINWSGTDPDQDTGTPAGSIVTVDIYVVIDGSTTPTLVGQFSAGTPNSSGVYSGSTTYDALADGNSHNYGFYSIGIDDEQKVQATSSSPIVPFNDITYSNTLAVEDLMVEKGIVERSFIQYLDVDFNMTTATSTELAAMQTALNNGDGSPYVELLWYGEGLTSSSVYQGSVNLSKPGEVTLSGNDLSINFGPNGITSLLTETGVTGTGSPTSSFGDGWYALGIDPAGNPSANQVVWLPFFRLLGSATGDTKVSGPYTMAGTDAYTVYHAEGETGPLLDADVNGDGAVNSKDLTETVEAEDANHSVGTTEPAVFPAFQLFAGAPAVPGHAAVLVTQAQVQSLLPTAIAAWQAAGLDAADVRELEGVTIQVGDLGTSILGLEAAGTITINQTAAGYNWYVNAGPGSGRAFGQAGPDGESVASPASPAADDVDLLTVLEHELGHVIGLADNAVAGDLMDITLGLGVRRAPTAADLATIAGSSTTTTVRAMTAAVVPSSVTQPVVLNGSVSSATVDAALASIAGAAVGDGDAPNPTIKPVTPAASMGPVPGPGMTPKKDRSAHPSRPYPHRTASLLFPRNMRGVGQSSSLDPRSSARARGGLE